ncbi:cytochrome c [Paraburkholderia sp. J12]|uniref:cytochrome c n=1 Tax=Paraburkholderia sp. J12 TaxID=2805432 RepID=UPI002ABDDC41|nr:cytochrome c [Paraburkholderia sp. J12]
MKNAHLLKAGFASAVLAVACHAGAVSAADVATDPAQAALIARGAYLAKAGDCAACHTAPGGKPMAGGLPIDSPFGKIYSSNITPSKSNGIGGYSEAQFARALRDGVRADGTHLYPAMPYPSYAGITDDDVKALYAYFMQDVQPVDAAAPPTQLKFPFDQRWLMAGWNLLFAGGQPGAPVEGKSAQWNRGRYLVQTLGHCDSCHAPRNFAMGEKLSLGLSGGQVGPWQAPNITSDPVSGIGGWSHGELVQYLRTGAVAGKGQAAGGMAEAIGKSLQYLSDDDLSAIATYLKESDPVRNPDDVRAAYDYGGSGENYEPALRAGNPGIGFNQPGPGYVALTTGAQLYSANCASCHQSSGGGTPDDAFPSLTHNTVLGRNNADNLVMVILEGLHIDTQDNDRQMPGFADDLNDQQIATLATFVMKQYGNPDVTVTPDRVALLRNGGPNPSAALLPAGAIGLLVLVLVVFGGFRLARRRRRAR